MNHVRLLFDENVPLAVDRGLHRRLIWMDTLRVGGSGAPTKSTFDRSLLLWCEETGRLLVTLDRRTMPVHFGAHLAAGHRASGVVLIRRGASLTAVIDDLHLICATTEAEEWTDRLLWIPL